jgi:hypothetical protein
VASRSLTRGHTVCRREAKRSDGRTRLSVRATSRLRRTSSKDGMAPRPGPIRDQGLREPAKWLREHRAPSERGHPDATQTATRLPGRERTQRPDRRLRVCSGAVWAVTGSLGCSTGCRRPDQRSAAAGAERRWTQQLGIDRHSRPHVAAVVGGPWTRVAAASAVWRLRRRCGGRGREAPPGSLASAPSVDVSLSKLSGQARREAPFHSSPCRVASAARLVA